MKVIKCYPRIIIHLMDSQFYKFEEYHKTHDCYSFKPIILISISWYFKEDSIPQFLPYKEQYDIVALANTEEEKTFYESTYGIESIFVNHNCFTNENEFFIEDDLEKKYDLFVNSAFDNYKNHYLTKLVESLVYVGRFESEKKFISCDLNYKAVFPNFDKNTPENLSTYKWLSADEIRKITNESFVAGIFSPVEGACFSSAQYLLCGVPVVSIKCRGGRELWYNENNSIICDNNPESVVEAIKLAKKKLENGSFNRDHIRKMHIEMQSEFRNKLVNFLIKKVKEVDSCFVIDFEVLKKQISIYEW